MQYVDLLKCKKNLSCFFHHINNSPGWQMFSLKALYDVVGIPFKLEPSDPCVLSQLGSVRGSASLNKVIGLVSQRRGDHCNTITIDISYRPSTTNFTQVALSFLIKVSFVSPFERQGQNTFLSFLIHVNSFGLVS